MEKKNIIHRGLKLENILYDFHDDDIKLIDFGLAKSHKPGKMYDRFAGEYHAFVRSVLHICRRTFTLVSTHEMFDV